MATDPLDLGSVMAPRLETLGTAHRRAQPWATCTCTSGSLDVAEAFYHRGARLRQDGVELCGRAVLFRRRLSPSSRHEYLVARAVSVTGSGATSGVGVIVPTDDDVAAVARSLRDAGYRAEDAADGVTAVDPWERGYLFERATRTPHEASRRTGLTNPIPASRSGRNTAVS